MAIVTLTTDFGPTGPFVGIMKGVILARCDSARIVDLTHEVHVHWPAEAGFWLQHSWQHFPTGTIHVAVVDPGVGTERDILIAECDGHVFLAPDNGLLAPILEDSTAHARTLSTEWLEEHDWPTASATFHGRDLFAPLAAEIAAGRVTPGELGPETQDYMTGLVDHPEREGRQLRGVVIAIDHFGNLITNIRADEIGGFALPLAQSGGHNFSFHRTYGMSRPGEYIALINSFGVVEISRVQGNAAGSLGLGRGTPVTISDARQ